MAKFYRLMGVDDRFDPSNRFETSWLLSPYLLGTWRTLLSLFCFFTTFYMFGWRDSHGRSLDSRRSFSYFTNLTYWGLSFYTLVAALHTFSYAHRGRALLDSWPRPLQLLHSLFYTTVVVYPFIVTIVYWAILYDGHWFPSEFDAFTNVSQHAMNSVIAFSEIVLPRTTPPPFLHIPFLIIILGLYLAVAYISRATENFYVYQFLNPDTGSGKVAGYCFGILAATIVVFLVVWVVIWLRKRITEDKLGMRNLHASAAQSSYVDVEMLSTRDKI